MRNSIRSSSIFVIAQGADKKVCIDFYSPFEQSILHCFQCLGSNFTTAELEDHKKSGHRHYPKGQTPAYSCQKCQSRFTKKRASAPHICCTEGKLWYNINFPKDESKDVNTKKANEILCTRCKFHYPATLSGIHEGLCREMHKAENAVTQTQGGSFLCKICNKSFQDQSSVLEHHNSQHKDQILNYENKSVIHERIQCKNCNPWKIFNDVASFNQHHIQSHANSSPNFQKIKSGELKCESCLFKTAKDEDMIKHYKECHGTNLSPLSVGRLAMGQGQSKSTYASAVRSNMGPGPNPNFSRNNAVPPRNNSGGNQPAQQRAQIPQNNQVRDQAPRDTRTVKVNGRDISVGYINGRLVNTQLRFLYINGLSFGRDYLQRQLANPAVVELFSTYFAPPRANPIPINNQ